MPGEPPATALAKCAARRVACAGSFRTRAVPAGPSAGTVVIEREGEGRHGAAFWQVVEIDGDRRQATRPISTPTPTGGSPSDARDAIDQIEGDAESRLIVAEEMRSISTAKPGATSSATCRSWASIHAGSTGLFGSRVARGDRGVATVGRLSRHGVSEAETTAGVARRPVPSGRPSLRPRPRRAGPSRTGSIGRTGARPGGAAPRTGCATTLRAIPTGCFPTRPFASGRDRGGVAGAGRSAGTRSSGMRRGPQDSDDGYGAISSSIPTVCLPKRTGPA